MSNEPLTQKEKETLAHLGGWSRVGDLVWIDKGNSPRRNPNTQTIKRIEDMFEELPPDMFRVLIRHYTEKR